jgi:hypothetical protein
MSRKLRVLFRRNPDRDRQQDDIHYEGYEILWPDRRPVSVGMDAFCKHGQRLFALGRHLAGRQERLLDLLIFPLRSREDNLTRIPGHRIRRFCLQRRGRHGRVHFLDGTPTAIVFELDRDDPRVLDWIGLSSLSDGGHLWFDIGAHAVEDSRIALPGLPLTERSLASDHRV